jgi:hypothetical protein
MAATKRILVALPFILLSALAIPVVMAQTAPSTAPATTTIKLTEVHMCCNTCVNGVKTATASITGLTATGEQASRSITLTAPNKETLQKGVDALTKVGYFGKVSDAAYKVDAETNAKDGKVQTVTVEGVHLCCGQCVTAVKAVVAKTPGVTGDNVTSRATSITLTGDFEPKTFFTELQKIGLTGKVKQ